MKKILTGLIIIILLVFLTVFVSKSFKKAPEYRTEKITRGSITETVTASGTVNPVVNISVGTQVSGTLKKLYVDFNSPVKKGQLLAEIDPSLFEAQVAQAQANLYNARANLQKIESIAANDKKTYERNKSLYVQNFIARSEVDLAEATYNSDKAQIASAKAQIAQASAVLRNNSANLRYTKILSPVDGIVVSRSVDVGQTVAASFQTPTLFMVAQDLTKMQIDTNVAEADIGKIKTGQDVEYTLDGYPDTTFSGKVRQVRISPTTVQNVVTYDVVIDVDNRDLKLKPGMTANVSIITAKKGNILIVPNSCLRFTPLTGDEKPNRFEHPGIWILKDDIPLRINVKTGISDGDNTEILSGKVSEGQQVIVSLTNGARKRNNASNPRFLHAPH